MWWRTAAMICVLALTGRAMGVESLNQRLAMTDMTDAESVWELALWCEEQRKAYMYRKYLQKVIDINPDHEPARLALGYIWYKDEWTHKSRVPRHVLAAQEKAEQEAEARRNPGPDETRRATGPAPTVDQIEWDLSIPPDPNPGDAPWVNEQINAMNRSGNYSDAMEQAYRTLLMDRYFPVAMHHLAKALLRDDFRDLYGVSMMISELQRARDQARLEQMKKLIPHMVKASSRVTDGEDLWAFASVVAISGERKAVPRLIEILETGGEDAREGAQAALSNITLMAEDSITPAAARDWWKKYHNASDSVVYGDAVRSNDLNKVLTACEKLVPHGWKLAIPNLIRVIEEGNTRHLLMADALLEQLTDSSWVEMDMSDAVREKKIEHLKNWWKDNKDSFVPPVIVKMRNAAIASSGGQSGPSKQQLVVERINKLASIEKLEVSSAANYIIKQDTDAIAPLITNGLNHSSGIVREESVKLLRQITGQHFAFSGLTGSEADRDAARNKWVEWATAEGHLGGETEAPPDGEQVPADQPAPGAAPGGRPERPRGPLPF